MFTKKPERGPVSFQPQRSAPAGQSGNQSAHRAPAARPEPQLGGVSQISADLTIVGNLVSQGEVRIDGEIQGDLHAATVVVGDSARISGSVVADEVIILGSVSGSVRGNRVTLQSTSRVEGDVFHQQLAIEQGAYFEGKSRRMDDPTAGVQPPQFSMMPATNGHAA